MSVVVIEHLPSFSLMATELIQGHEEKLRHICRLLCAEQLLMGSTVWPDVCILCEKMRPVVEIRFRTFSTTLEHEYNSPVATQSEVGKNVTMGEVNWLVDVPKISILAVTFLKPTIIVLPSELSMSTVTAFSLEFILHISDPSGFVNKTS